VEEKEKKIAILHKKESKEGASTRRKKNGRKRREKKNRVHVRLYRSDRGGPCL